MAAGGPALRHATVVVDGTVYDLLSNSDQHPLCNGATASARWPRGQSISANLGKSGCNGPFSQSSVSRFTIGGF